MSFDEFPDQINPRVAAMEKRAAIKSQMVNAATLALQQLWKHHDEIRDNDVTLIQNEEMTSLLDYSSGDAPETVQALKTIALDTGEETMKKLGYDDETLIDEYRSAVNTFFDT